MLEQMLQSGDYAAALESIKNGEKRSKTIFDFNRSQIFDKLLRDKQFEILNYFVKDKTIETDIYEYDSFDKSIFASIIRNLSDESESNDFFRDFMTKFDNINDEVATKTLLSYFFENAAKLEHIKILIEAGCSINFKNNAEENLLHQVINAYSREPELSLAYLSLLIDEGLDINEANIVRKTPLIAAFERNKKEYIDLLLQNGADPNHVDKDGNTAFFYAVAHQLNLDLYNKLREYDSPQFDLLNRNQVSLLFEYMRMMNSPSESMLELLSKLINDGADLYHESFYYQSPTIPINLIAEKDPAVLQTIIDTGALDINRQDNEGNTLLHKVCAYNVNYEERKAKETYRKVKLLLENGADPSITNNKDQSALILASDDNLKIKTVELLMKNQQNA
ncbi:Ankyrin repeat-containing protein [Mucilaginibacter sp. OK268]|uniref:ankyrin repeat domain-containing protein n=1 Tax=Mucilaginibacter sp. OK268 TaxID=1881048 RepID=UPI00088DEB4B|nr:ankyrin repeat domain-containing protein [Mucilaginibacter sp. OK268]SDP72464.1 Ankyrin repeat-containing protein [Mucilaginibacter sp. OK268]